MAIICRIKRLICLGIYNPEILRENISMVLQDRDNLFDVSVKNSAKAKLAAMFPPANFNPAASELNRALALLPFYWMSEADDPALNDAFWQVANPDNARVGVAFLPASHSDLRPWNPELITSDFVVSVDEHCPIGLAEPLDPDDACAIVDRENKTVHVFNYKNLCNWLKISNKNPMNNRPVTFDMLTVYPLAPVRAENSEPASY